MRVFTVLSLLVTHFDKGSMYLIEHIGSDFNGPLMLSCIVFMIQWSKRIVSNKNHGNCSTSKSAILQLKTILVCVAYLPLIVKTSIIHNSIQIDHLQVGTTKSLQIKGINQPFLHRKYKLLASTLLNSTFGTSQSISSISIECK